MTKTKRPRARKPDLIHILEASICANDCDHLLIQSTMIDGSILLDNGDARKLIKWLEQYLAWAEAREK